MIDELSKRRVYNAADNTEISPVDLLETLLAEVKSGETVMDAVYVIVVDRSSPDDDGGRISTESKPWRR